MNARPEEELIAALGPMLRRLCERDPDTARLVGAIGRWLSAVAEASQMVGGTERGNGAVETAPAAKPRSAAAVDSGSTSRPPPVPVPLKLGDSMAMVPVSGTAEEIKAAREAVPSPTAAAPRPSTALPDLSLVARRCSLKALACEVAAALAEAVSPDDQSRAKAEMDRLLEARQSLTDCFLWMFHRDYKISPLDLRMIRPCYENLALACGIIGRVPRRNQPEYRRAVELLAEAQSAVRKALQDAWLTITDRDQDEAFIWLDRVTDSERIFVARHMRLDDPADPSRHVDLRARLEALERELREAEARSKEGNTVLNRLRYHVMKIVKPEQDDHSHDWEVVTEALARLEELGIVAGDDRLTDALEPLLRLPEEKWEVSEESRGRLRAVREMMASDESSAAGPALVQKPESADVARVRDWLRGKRAVIIGGERKSHAAERIQRAFGLSELDWLELTEHGKTAPIDPPIADPSTAVVWAVVRLTGHVHMDVAADACRKYGRPFVRLPGGYNPSQIAARTIEQASEAFSA